MDVEKKDIFKETALIKNEEEAEATVEEDL